MPLGAYFMSLAHIYIYTSARTKHKNTKMAVLEKLAYIPKNVCSVLSVSWVSILIVGCIYDFHVAYVSFLEQIKSEQWLLQHCEDDDFFHNMQYHTDVCRDVVANSNIWPSLYAINQSASKMKLCGLYDCGALFSIVYNGGIPVMVCIFLLYIVTPSFILPILQRTYHCYCEQNIMAKCSPIYKQSKTSHPLCFDPIDTYPDYKRQGPHDNSPPRLDTKIKYV